MSNQIQNEQKKVGLHSLHILILLLLFLTIGSIAVGIFVQKNGVVKMFDDYFYVLITNLPHNKTIDTIIFPFDLWFLPWKIFFLPAYFYFLIIPFLLYIFIKRRKEFVWAFLALFIGTQIVGLLLTLNWHFVFRERPFTTLPNIHISEAAKHALKKWPSFPSGHTRDTAMVAGIISAFVPQLKFPLLFFSFFIAFTRVYTGAHYPTDVIAGLIFGYASAKVALIIVDEIKKIIPHVKNIYLKKKYS